MSIAGSKCTTLERVKEKGLNIKDVRLWKALGNKLMTGHDVYTELASIARPIQLELGVGNTCGLHCKHCFLSYSEQETIKQVELEILKQTIKDSVETLGTRIVCFTDRDALTPGRSEVLFDFVAGLREKYPDLKFGGVTNGLNMERFLDTLRRAQPDYLDISFEGLESEHDAIRGKGAYQSALKGLRTAIRLNVASQVVVSCTLSRFNYHSLINLVKKFIKEEGVRNFDISLLIPVKMKQHHLQPEEVTNFLYALKNKLASVEVNEPVRIYFEICCYCAPVLPELIETGWLIPENIEKDPYGRLYQDIAITDMITLSLRPELIPEYWWKTLRITADGYVIGGCEPLIVKNFKDISVGNIKDESIVTIYERAISQGSIFHQMMLAYDRCVCRGRQCFRYCLGGDQLLTKVLKGEFHLFNPLCQEVEPVVSFSAEKEVVYA